MSKEKVKIKENLALERDTQTNAIINTSRTEYNKAKESRQRRLNVEKRVEVLEDKLDKIIGILEKDAD